MEAFHNKVSLTSRKELAIHLFLWFLLAYFTLFQVDRSSPFYLVIETPDIFTVSWTLVFMISFYFNYFLVLPRIFRNFSWKKAGLGFFTSFVFFVGLRFLIEETLLELIFGLSNYFEDTPLWYYLYDNIYYSTFPIIPSTLIWLIVFLVRLLEYNNFVVEEQKNTEIKFLKAQLNPHFMFNTLNNIYSLVYFRSEKALSAIEKLSGIMRFTTYESQKERIYLEEEISYIRSYIELEQLRQNESRLFEIELNVKDLQKQIPPLLLTPLVENAIKHGPMTAEVPVKISLEQHGRHLKLVVTNRIGKQHKDSTGGIGLYNLKKRLNIYFPNQHELRLKKEDQKFIAELEIHF